MHILLRGQVAFLQQHGFEVLAVTGEGPEVAAIRKSGVHLQVVPMTRRITPLADLLSLVRIIRVIRKFKPQIVHTHTPKAGVLGMLAAWLCKVPVRMHTVAGLPLVETTGFKRWILERVERIQYACATKVYPNSEGLRKFICSNFQVRPVHLRVIGRGSSNGIDSTFFQRSAEIDQQAQAIRREYGLTDGTFIVCFIGRIVKDKGIAELVRAFRKLNDVNARLLVVGPFEHELDPLPPDIENFLRSNERVILAGFQQDVRPWLAVSSIFAFPSYREGFPNAVMQAACMQLPCVVSDINGCNEIIEHGVSGLIVPPKRDLELSDAIETLHRDESLRTALGRRAREYVVKNFNQQYVWKELLKEYRSFL
jgi:glycosyltransferase involved in cell wall biosynthesis